MLVKKYEWKCDICGKVYVEKQFLGICYGDVPFTIIGHEELFCSICRYNGMLWAIKQANKEVSKNEEEEE
ncbi:hypothetical protein ES703_94378 [subsurface metagenome]